VNPSPDEGVAQKKRILVGDDEPAVTSVIVRFLERAGLYEAIALNDPTKAVEVAREFRPDLVVLDIVMPTMDGGEVLAALREHEGLSDVRAIYLTGLVSECEVGPEGYAVAGHPVIPKPVGRTNSARSSRSNSASSSSARLLGTQVCRTRNGVGSDVCALSKAFP